MFTRFCMVILSLALVSATVEARTWHVRADGSGDAPTIQAGVDSAAQSDTILVGAGTYDENIDMSGKELRLLSESGPGSTVIDGGGRERVLTMTSGTVIGFTLRNGVTEYTGGGLLVVGPGGSLVRGNVIENNTSGIDFDIGSGGGVYLDEPTNGVILEDNVIRNNLAGDGGGGVADHGGRTTRNEFRQNTISGNQCKNGGAGAVLFVSQFVENRVFANSCLYGGGGVLVVLDGHAIVEHNTVMSNSTHNLVRVNGSGIQNDGAALIRWNIVMDNHGEGTGAGISSASLPRPICNDIWHNDIDGVFGSDTTGTQTFSADPQFCAVDPVTSGNFTLQSDSPCSGTTGTCGLVGAAPVECGTVSVERRTWTGVKLLFR